VLILASDTSTKTESVALLRDEVVVAEYLGNAEKHHGETLLPTIAALLDGAAVAIDDIDVFVVTLGPGSFTGIRIGVSTVKGLVMATEKPVVGVSSLAALAMNLPNSMVPICPMLDARKNEVYTALYRPGKGGVPEKVLDERVTTPLAFLDHIHEDVIFIGDGAVVYEHHIRNEFPHTSYFALGNLNYIRGSSVGLIGLKKYRDGDTLNLLGFTPEYLRLSEAEVKQRGKK